MYPISPMVRRKFNDTTTSLTNGSGTSSNTITGNVATTALSASHTVDTVCTGSTNNVIIVADNDVVPIESNNVIRKRCSSADLYVYDRFPIYEQNNNNNSCSIGIDQSTNDDAEGNCNTIDEEEYAIDINTDANDNSLLLESDTLLTSEGCIVSLLPGIHEFMPNDTLSHEIDGYTRPYFLYSQVIKGCETTSVGISFYTKRTRISQFRFVSTVIIAHIADDGLFGKSNNNCLLAGDEVVAVNNLPATTMNSYRVAKLLRTATGIISLTVRYPVGDPRLLFSSIQKPSSNSMVGLALSNKCFGNSLYITKVEPDGLFASSLLMPGQRCLMINGISCRNLPSPEAVKLIHRKVINDTDVGIVDHHHDTTSTSSIPHHVSFISKVSTKSFDYASVLSSDNNMNSLTYYQKFIPKVFRLGSNNNNTNNKNRDGGQTIIAIATAVEDSSLYINNSSTSTNRRNRRRRRQL